MPPDMTPIILNAARDSFARNEAALRYLAFVERWDAIWRDLFGDEPNA